MSQRAVVLHDKMTLRNLVVRPLKLVRDKIPILIAKKGDRVPYNAPASGARLQGYVAAKLAEEGTEFAEAPSLDELADVQEVVDTALRTFGWTRTQLGEAMRKKREERGGFSKGIIMYFNPDDEVPPP